MDSIETNQEELGGQMSFLEHLDEFRRRLINSAIIVVIAFVVCFFVSDRIYDFLSVPIRKALSETERRPIPVQGVTGNEKVLLLAESNLTEGAVGRYVFDQATTLEIGIVPAGTSVLAKVDRDINGKIGLFTDEPIFTSNAIIQKGIKLPVNLENPSENIVAEEKMTVTTATASFTLFVTVSLYTAIAVSIPFLLWQIWGFISPALYRHERSYVTPFIGLSSISFIAGAAFAYYILFPPAARYLLGLGKDFKLLLSANDYFDFITLIMLAMGVVFQMPAISYVLSRIGIISAGFLVRVWKIALIVILIVAAIVSPTPDAVNMMLFALPMMFLYVISIFIAWFFGKKRMNDEQVESLADLE